MIYLNIIFIVIVVMAVTFFIFHPKDVLGFWVVNIKKVAVGMYNMVRNWIK